MRRTFTPFLVLFASICDAQTVTSVQSGPWNSPSTWDCGCVPDFSQSVVIANSVEITEALLLGHQQVLVAIGGELTMTLPATVSFNTVLINEGHVLVMGDILNSGLFNNAGFAEFVGSLLNDGSIISVLGAFMQVEGDFVNQDLVQGEGAICVTDLTDNQGSISGTLDFCDQSPTVNVAPFVDLNTGAVESGITFCQNSPCATSVQESFAADMELSPVIASDLITLTRMPAGVMVTVLDASGRLSRPVPARLTDRTEVDLSGLAAGPYRVVVRGPAGQRVLPFVIVR